MVAGLQRRAVHVIKGMMLGLWGLFFLPLTTLPKEVAGNELFIAEHGERNMLFEAITWLNLIADL